ncbi:MAG: FkbM family methyltransferase [Rhodospirillales bacterium]|nr:FkbM family methyltransferase [Rhodospirillales bacterium]
MTDGGAFARLLGPASLLRYAWWRLRGRRATVHLRLRNGPRLLLRPRSAGNNDYGVAYEIFVHRYYACPRPLPAGSVRLVVDLGANVGFSCLHWLTHYPHANIVALEPHPGHFAQCRANIAANGWLPRVELTRAAAGVAAQRIILSDAGAASAVRSGDAAGIAAPMLDVYAMLSGRPVDILKLDIEGSEYPILADPRFNLLRPRCVVMEWHGGGAGRQWCLARFAALHYETTELFDHESHGMLWAFRRADDGASRQRCSTDGGAG